MNRILCLIVSVVFSLPLYAVDCTTENIVLTTQTEVDTFQTTYGGGGVCDRVVGNLTVKGSSLAPSNILDLDGLSSITSVGGSLTISGNDVLKNIDGLSSLSSLGGDLLIQVNPTLRAIDGLLQITRISGNLKITNNGLTDVDGLVNLQSVSGSVLIVDNDSLISIDGFENIDYIGADFRVSGNAVLANINGLPRLANIGGDLEIGFECLALPPLPPDSCTTGYEEQLTAIDGFPNLSSVGGSVIVHNNPKLASVAGLGKIVALNGDLHLIGLPSLTDVSGFVGISSIAGNLIIGQTNLANLNALSSLSNIDGELEIFNNPLLNNIDGLSGITLVDGLSITANSNLIDVDGLINIVRVNGNLSVVNNPLLENLLGFSNLTAVIGGLQIGSNTNLADFNLPNLSEIGDYLYISGTNNLIGFGIPKITTVKRLGISFNDLLQNLDGLSGLTFVEGDVFLSNNRSLENLTGLSGLSAAGGYFSITENRQLSSLDGIENLVSVGGDFKVRSNGALSDCKAAASMIGWPFGPPADSVGGGIEMAYNLTGCNSIEEVLFSIPDPTQPRIVSAQAEGDQATIYFAESTVQDNPTLTVVYELQCDRLVEEYISSLDPLPIPDGGTLQTSISLSDIGPVPIPPFIEVDIGISHTRPRHLIVDLTSPAGSTVVLWNQGTDFETDLVGTFPTTLNPVQDLATFETEDLNGIWTMTVTDAVISQIGTLNYWGVRIHEQASSIGYSSPMFVDNLVQDRVYTCTLSALQYGGLNGPIHISSDPQLITPIEPPIFRDGFETR